MPSTTALRQCPDLIFVPPRFEVYRAVSRQIREIFAEYTPLIEPLSLDEAYLDVTENLRDLRRPPKQRPKSVRVFLAETRLTASAGISYNKFLAKLASDMRKPNGQFVIPPRRGEDFIESLPVKKFHGVGPVTAEKLHAPGIHTGADLKRSRWPSWSSTLANRAPGIYAIARGEDDRPVEPNWPRKSSGSETTFAEDRSQPAEIEAGIIEMADDVWAWCEKNQSFGSAVTVKIKFADFRIDNPEPHLSHGP